MRLYGRQLCPPYVRDHYHRDNLYASLLYRDLVAECFQVLAAFVNGLALVAVVGWIGIEAVRRLFAPVEVLGGLMLAIAALGLLVNLAAFAILRRGDRDNLNVQGAVLHVLADLLG